MTALSGAKVKAGPAHVSRRWAYNHRMVQSPRACYAAAEKVRWLSGLGVLAEDAPALPRIHLAPRPATLANVSVLIYFDNGQSGLLWQRLSIDQTVLFILLILVVVFVLILALARSSRRARARRRGSGRREESSWAEVFK